MSLLSGAGVTKRFGGIVANRNISFAVAPGELVGVIGPNGAGKSTLFEVVSGFYRPDAGEVRLDATRLTGLSPDRICRLGVARTFQKLRPFSGMTVLQNVMVGALTRTHDVGAAREQALGVADRGRAGDGVADVTARVRDDFSYRVYSKYFKWDSSTDEGGNDVFDGWDTMRMGFRIDGGSASADAFTVQGDVYRGEYGETLVVDWGLAKEVGSGQWIAGGEGGGDAASSLPTAHCPLSTIHCPPFFEVML